MSSRRCNLRCEKKDTDPDRGRTTTGGTLVALSAFHESPLPLPENSPAIHGWGIAQERKKSRRDERTVAVPYDVFKPRLSGGQQHG